MTQGIYKLINNINDKVYIGQSKDIESRYFSHVEMLRVRKHHSYKLQNFYNQNTDVEIDYKILENVENEKYLLAREKHYIDLYNSYENGYNVINPKNYDAKNNRYTKLEDAKDEFEYLTSKYEYNLVLKRNKYSYTMLEKINECIKHFVKNYNLDDYRCEIKQYKWKLEFDVTGVYIPYYKKFTYSNDSGCVMSEQEILKYSYKNKDLYVKAPTLSKLSDIQKIKRLYIWFIKQLSKSSEKMLQHIDREDSTYYFISHSTIKKYINCNEDNFNKNILSNPDMWNIEKQLKIHHSYREKCLIIEKPVYLQALAMEQKQIKK